MSIYGADKQDDLSTQQINHFLRLCIRCADFSQEGLLRFDGSDQLLDYWYKDLFPALEQEHIRTEELMDKILKPEVPSKSDSLDQDASTSARDIHRALLQIFKQITSGNKHFLANECGPILRKHFLAQLQNYFWPMLLYVDEAFSDTEYVREKKDENYNAHSVEFFMQGIAFLLSNRRDDLAEIMHNILYIGHLCHRGDKATNTPFVIGKLIAPSLLFKPFELSGKILPDEDYWGKKEVTLCAEMIASAINSSWFQVPFSEQKSAYRLDMKLTHLEASEVALVDVARSLARRRHSKAAEQMVVVHNPLFGRRSRHKDDALILKLQALALEIKKEQSMGRKCDDTHSASTSTSTSDSEPRRLECISASDSRSRYVPVLPLALVNQGESHPELVRQRNFGGAARGKSDSDSETESDKDEDAVLKKRIGRRKH